MTEMSAPPIRYGMRRYALIDRGQEMTVAEGQAWTPVVPLWLAEVAAQLPVLLEITRLESQASVALECWTEQARKSDGGCGITLLDTAVSGEVLLEHLCGNLLWPGADGRRHLLRYFDARVMAQLEWLLTGSALDRLLGPICEWHLALDGGWHTIAAEGSRPYVPPPSGMDTCTALAWMDVITPAIAEAGPTNVKQRQRMAQRAYELLWTAQRRFGLRDRMDLSLFVQHGLCLHPQFHDHPLVRRPLEQQHGSDFCYRLIAAQWGADALQRVRADLIHLRGELQ